MIYMIRAIGTGYVKIGKASGADIEPRLIQLQVGCPFELRVIARVDCPDYMEGELHRHLYRDAIRGEWFKLGDRTRRVLTIMQNGRLEGWQAYLDALRQNGQGSRLQAVVNYAHGLVG